MASISEGNVSADESARNGSEKSICITYLRCLGYCLTIPLPSHFRLFSTTTFLILIFIFVSLLIVFSSVSFFLHFPPKKFACLYKTYFLFLSLSRSVIVLLLLKSLLNCAENNVETVRHIQIYTHTLWYTARASWQR